MPRRSFSPPRGAKRPNRLGVGTGFCVALGVALVLAPPAVGPAAAQDTGNRSVPPQGTPADKMFVEAAEVRYDIDKNIASAEGNVRVYYHNRVLESDRLIYDRSSGRVYAEGHAKLTEADGTMYRGDRFDLTEDFRDGFIDSLRVEAPDKAFFSAPHAERIALDTTVFDKGTFTTCYVCSEDPSRPPLWRVRAKRIIHKNDEKMIYYEDAGLDFLGISTPYLPFFSSPDPSVKRKSGILTPRFITGDRRGVGLAVPIFFALAPNYDLTLTPTYLSAQGFFGRADWRHRLEHGEYYIRASGIAQQDKDLFPQPPFGAGDRVFRGSLESKGQFRIADLWKFGWEFTLLTDRWFLFDYHVPSQTLAYYYFSESVSTAYLTGQGNRGYFDISGYYFQGLSSHDFQPQQAYAHPVWDYNKSIDIDPAHTMGIGGEVTVDFNLTSLSANAASFQAVGPRVLDNAFGLYEICANYVPGQAVGNCLLRGVGGDYTRGTAEASYKRKWIDPIGEVWTPFAFARFNGEWFDINQTRSYTFASGYGVSTYTNAEQLNFIGDKDSSFFGAVIPGVGLDYRYPFFAATSLGSIVVEPIAQIIARPNQQLGNQSLVNLDAQSLVFDDSTLFTWSKYSGYDRFETGTRANYGGQFTLNFPNGGYLNAIAGQSYQLAGTNSYAKADAANVGLSSGLDFRLSDLVAAFSVAPTQVVNISAKGRFDVDTLEPRRIDLVSTFNFGSLFTQVQYANYSAQPVLGYDVRREGLGVYSRYQVTKNYFTQGNVTFDMSRHLYPTSLIGTTNPGTFFVASFGVGGGYEDECTTFSVNYRSLFQDNGNGSSVRSQTFLVQLQLRALGDERYAPVRTSGGSLDGVKY